MKSIVLFGLLAMASFGAIADMDAISQALSTQAKDGRVRFCFSMAALYESVSGWRDDGMDPQFSFQHSKAFELSDKDTKIAINDIYFNPSLVQVSGRALGNAVRNVCLNGPPKPFEPLK